MLPGPPPPLLMGYPTVPSASPSATPSSSIGASIAIIVIVIIASTLLICFIKVLCRSPHRPRPAWSSFSRHSSISRRASSPGEFDRKRAVASAVHPSPRASASPKKHAEGLLFGLEVSGPSAPSLPEVELVILGLLSQPPVLLQKGMFYCISAQEFAPTDRILALSACLHKFHELCIIPWIHCHTPYCCPFCDASITIPCADPDKTYTSDQYDLRLERRWQRLWGSCGWLRSSLDRLSGSWSGCSSNHATAVVVPVSSRHTTGSWRVDTSDKENIEAPGEKCLPHYIAELWSSSSSRFASPHVDRI
ncbi:hypothetical protein ZWY2020_017587 [Hordeum vulgare]|nr:hypothetical protein ZWY2020_017587 [Hordeum vulgare]